MATMSRVRRLTNPGKKRRKLSALQKLFFGSKRQRAAVANRGKRHNISFRKYKKAIKTHHRKMGVSKAISKGVVRKRRRRNISSIVSILPNPARRRRRTYKRKANKGKKVVVINRGRKTMARRRRSSVARNPRRRRVYRRRRNYGTQLGRSWSTYKPRGRKKNPGRRRRYARRRNPGVMRHHRRRRSYRRNPGFLTGGGTMTSVLGVVGGVALTKLLMGFVPSQFSTGIIGYLVTGAVAVLQGKAVGKVAKSPSLGHNMMVGGLAYLTAKVLNDFLPSIGGYTGISGMGLIGPSSFYTPQVNQNGSMGSFVTPAAVMGAIPMAPPSAGVGRLRRTGRLM